MYGYNTYVVKIAFLFAATGNADERIATQR
jgi:hypothetical protein